MPDRAVVTGLGAVTPFGAGIAALWEGLVAGRSALGPLPADAVAPARDGRGGAVAEDVSPFDGVARCRSFAARAGREAIEQAGLSADAVRAAWVLVGTVIGPRAAIEYEAGGRWPATHAPVERFATDVAADLGAEGLAYVIGNACAAGNTAIIEAAEAIERGDAEVCVVVGAEELTATMVAMFRRFRSEADDVPKPFDVRRDGLLLSEGAGALVLEARSHAERRGARVLAEVAGWANAADAHHMTAPHPEGRGASSAMATALARAGVEPAACDLVCAHGTGTKLNDVIEGRAIDELFDGRPPVVTSLKGALGHLQGAASAVEAVACVLSIDSSTIPPTATCTDADPECRVVPPRQAVEQRVGAALNNSFGFGGNVACVLFTAP